MKKFYNCWARFTLFAAMIKVVWSACVYMQRYYEDKHHWRAKCYQFKDQPCISNNTHLKTMVFRFFGAVNALTYDIKYQFDKLWKKSYLIRA